MQRVLLGGIWFLSVAAWGCAGDSGGAPSGGGSGSGSSSTQLSKLTASQRVDLCNKHKTDIETGAKNYCVTAGIGAASKTACEQKRDECVAKVAVDCNTNFGDLKDCTVTVTEFESCFGMVVNWSKTLSCDAFDKKPADLPTCVGTLDMKCPGALDMIM